MNSIGAIYLESAIKRLMTYKNLGDKTFEQLDEKDFHFVPGVRVVPGAPAPVVPVLPAASSSPMPAASAGAKDGPSAGDGPSASFHANAGQSSSNSIAVVIRHLHGNMISRWTNFLTEDGEKEGRNRDAEFTPPAMSKDDLIALWEEGWHRLLSALQSLKAEDLLKTIYIRHEPLIAIDAINRQLAHYPHHVGQIVYIGKMIRNEKWQSLSIAKGASGDFNERMKDQHGTGK